MSTDDFPFQKKASSPINLNKQTIKKYYAAHNLSNDKSAQPSSLVRKGNVGLEQIKQP